MQNRSRAGLRALTAVISITLAMASFSPAQTRPATQPDEPKLYCVGYSHLDTQWRWSYPQVISEFLHNTLANNFRLFEKYPHYVFNFTGANRYMMFKEYYPQDYQTLKKYIADGRWFPGGSSMEEGDVNMPDGESIIRQVLYGNEFFRKEFGTQSCEFMLPDCFGFQASLPSLLAHCGLKGFSTQKLTWGSAVGIPFNVGVWEGPDGKQIIAALNPGSYGSSIAEDLSHNEMWKQRIEADGQKSGVYSDYRYYGVGDRGGSPKEESIQWLEKSVAGNGPVHVISATSDQMFKDLTPEQVAKLPRYKGDLLLTNHSTGELTSQAYMKRCERKIEQLADAAERASVAADWLGGAAYPMQKLNAAWYLMLGAQFHDSMAGTALPKAYEYTWNNEILSMNQFAAAEQDGAGAVIRAMDTQGQGVPVVVYNPLSIDREDVVEATITVPDSFSHGIHVTGPDGKEALSQVLGREGNQLHLLFLAKAPSVGFAVYEVEPGTLATEAKGQVAVAADGLSNLRFTVNVNNDGDITSIGDKQTGREVLSAPARLEFLHENPAEYPAWNMDYADRMRAPEAYATGPCKVRVIESGPVRVALEIERQARGSRIIQQIRLCAGSAGNQVEVSSKIDWQTPASSLEAVFPLVASNPLASYESQSAAVKRGNNEPKKFEVPQQQWLDLTDKSGTFGTSILNDCKYGSDKPDDNTIRLTLLYTPGTRAGYQDQGSQDFGHHEMVYAIAPHANGWEKAGTPSLAQRLNQPLMSFQSPAHEGPLGRTFSLCRVSSDHVTTTAIKQSEDTDEIIVRLHEVNGQPADGVQVNFAGAIKSAREVDGQEREIGAADIREGHLVVTMQPFSLRAFAVKLAPPATPLVTPVSQSLPLACDLDGVSSHENLSDGAFDSEGHTFAAEAWPEQIVSEGIPFALGSKADGQKNALVCRGQTIALPNNGFSRVYLLAASVGGDVPTVIKIDGNPQNVVIQDWSSPIGLWDNRIWQGVVPGLTYNWKNKLAGLAPGFIKRDTVAWYSSHRHDPQRGNEYYQFTYLFKYGFDLPAGAKTLTLPVDDHVRIFAVTVSKNQNDSAQPAQPLYDTLQNRAENLQPAFSPPGGKFKDTTTVTIAHPLYWKEHVLRYTLDGSEPTAESPVYTEPVRLSQKTTVKAKEIDGTLVEGKTATAEFDVDDTTPPKVVSATGVSVAPSIELQFDEPVRKDQAQKIENYRFDPPLQIASADLSGDGTRLHLALKSPLLASVYQLYITDVSDGSPNANRVTSAPIPVSVAQPVFAMDSYVCAGKTMEKPVDGLPVKAGDSWTINAFVKTPQQPEDRTIIAGFGRNDDSDLDGCGRYLSKFTSGIHFWGRNADGGSRTPLTVNHWQMLTATFDGKTLQLFKDGKTIGQQAISLSDDESVVRIAPLDPWDHQRQFKGEIRDFTIWKSALSADSLGTILQSIPKE